MSGRMYIALPRDKSHRILFLKKNPDTRNPVGNGVTNLIN